jgi:hypothetical protein
MFHRIFPAGAAGTWVAKTPRGDGLLVRRSLRRPRGHPFGTGRPLVSTVLLQRNLGRGCDPQCSDGAHSPFPKRPERLLPYAYG